MNDTAENTEVQNTAIATTEVERLLQTSERLLKSQHRRLAQEHANYDTACTVMMNEYKAKKAQLDHDIKEALFLIRQDHQVKVHEIERLIAKLTALREA